MNSFLILGKCNSVIFSSNYLWRHIDDEWFGGRFARSTLSTTERQSLLTSSARQKLLICYSYYYNFLGEYKVLPLIEKVKKPCPWTSPIVAIFKPNKDIRICADMRRVNEATLRENYPFPTFDAFMAKLRNAKYSQD